MNKEEKKVIERIEDTFYSDSGKSINKFQKITLYEDGIKDVRTVLNLIEKLHKENESLKQEITVLQNTKDTCPEFGTSGVRCSLKQENEKLKTQIPNLKNGTYIGDYQGLLKLEKEITERENIIKQLRTEVNSLKKENRELKNEIMEKDLEIIGKEEYTKASMGEIIEQYYTANEDCIPVQKVKDIQKEKEWALESYDCTEADYKQSQAIGAWSVLQELLEGRKEREE